MPRPKKRGDMTSFLERIPINTPKTQMEKAGNYFGYSGDFVKGTFQ